MSRRFARSTVVLLALIVAALPGVAAAQEPVPVRVGGMIKEPIKIKHVDPVYPEIAKNAKIQGVVILETTIARDGTVRDVRVLRPVALLTDAAIAAVKQWQYTETQVNGEAVEVLMTVTVNFNLNDDGSPAPSAKGAAPLAVDGKLIKEPALLKRIEPATSRCCAASIC
jgi:protein TonB